MIYKRYVLAGDSWAWKAYTQENYDKSTLLETDQRLSDFWGIEYNTCITPGLGNLDILDRLQALELDPTTPIIWIYTEPGRDYNKMTGRPEFEWMEREDIFEVRRELDLEILQTIRDRLPNPIGLIGGLSDVDVSAAEHHGFDVLHHSWQKWIADILDSQWFKFGWGASDVGWHTHCHGVTPSRAATFAWDEQIKEWCWWEDQGWFCHEHPSPKAHQRFAEFLEADVRAWIDKHDR